MSGAGPAADSGARGGIMNGRPARPLQFSVDYRATEDRLRLRSGLSNGTEMRFMLTRRLTRGLFGAAEQVAPRLVGSTVSDPVAQAKVAEFTREAAAQEADFGQDYRAGQPHPVTPDGPRLVTGMSLTPRPGSLVDFAFTLDRGETVTFTIGVVHFWNVIGMIGRKAAAAEWDLGPLPAAELSGEPPAGPVN